MHNAILTKESKAVGTVVVVKDHTLQKNLVPSARVTANGELIVEWDGHEIFFTPSDTVQLLKEKRSNQIEMESIVAELAQTA